ncbi:hypothetical protein Nmel_002054, partial [Mimus melanotis]
MGEGAGAVENTGEGQCHHWGQGSGCGPVSCPAAPATLSVLPDPTEPLLSLLLLLLQAMAGKITRILLVLAILQYGLRADAQAAQTTAEVLTQHEEQHSRMSWLARAGRITKFLVLLGILQYTVRMDLPSVKVTEDLVKQHEKERIVEMAQMLVMEQRMQKQLGFTPGRMLLLVCQEWWFWVAAEILLVFFGIYWLPRQSSSDCEDGSQEETSTSAQEQIE